MKSSSTSKIFALLWAVIYCCSARGQSKMITGRVTGEENKPLQNVSVIVKGKTSGVQTKIDGAYSIDASPGDILVFTFVGYEPQEVRVGVGAMIGVSLKASSKKMDEVIVVGYGTQLRRNITSSIGKLDSQVLATSPIANVATALQGTVAGLQVVNEIGRAHV